MTNERNSVVQRPAHALARALTQPGSSDRLQAALAAGTHPDPAFAVPLINRCAIEPDFYVRDMLTWALIRLPRETVLPLALAELESPIPQARSQAIHTLTKLNAYEHWQSILPSHLHDPDHEVARAAWRAAAMLTPFEHADRLTAELITELGRGDFEVQRSLSRALVELGETSETKVEAVASSAESSAAVRAHAVATLRLIVDPESTFVIGVGS